MQQSVRFDDDTIQSKLAQRARDAGVAFSTDDVGTILVNEPEWFAFSDLEISLLDDEFGVNWVAVYARDADERAQRTELLRQGGVRFVVWFHSREGTSIVLDKSACPPDWEHV
jgi:hypothetical protein